MNVGEKIRRWWDGETKPYDTPGVIGLYTERHWTSQAAHTGWDFYRKNWQWIIGTIVAIILGVMAL